jgi:hypothetical protein
MKRAGQGVREGGFANSRDIFNEQVSTGNERNYAKPDGFRFSLDNRLDCLLQTLDLFDRLSGHQRRLPFYRFETSHQLAPQSSPNSLHSTC